MNDPARVVGQLEQFTTVEVRLAASAFLVAVALAAVGVAWYARPRLRRRMPSRVVDVVLICGVGAVVVLSAASLIVLWKQVGVAESAYAALRTTGKTGAQLLLTVGILAGSYVATGFISRAIDRFSEGREAITEHQSEIIYRTVQLSLYVIAVIAVLGIWDYDLGGLLVGAGFLGIVVGMAARQTLGSLLAGFVLMFARPFEIGDWVEIGNEEGIVTDISIVNTRIQTFDGEYVMIPNDTVSATTIINRTQKGRLRLQIDVGVDYDADVERAAEVAATAMKEVDDVLTVPVPQVVMKEFGDSAIVLGLRFWIDKPSSRRKWRAKTAVITEVKRAFDREGIKIPFPQRELAGRQETGGFRVKGESAVDEPEPTPDGGQE